MPLTTCIECHYSISESADTCPRCSSRRPFGVVCELCGERLPWSAAVVSKRLESQLSRSDIDYRSWHIRDAVDSEIVAHTDCLVQFFTPPIVECSDCGLHVSTSDLGLTPLRLWKASAPESVRCPHCRNYISLGAECVWAGQYGEHFVQTSSGAYPCMRPFYSFQAAPNGLGHGSHVKQERHLASLRSVAEANEASRRAWDEIGASERRKKAREETKKQGCFLVICSVLVLLLYWYFSFRSW